MNGLSLSTQSPFTTLIESLNELALAEKEAFFLNADKVTKNKELFERLKKAGAFSRFPELQWLMAKTAENAELWPEAIQYYGNLLAYYDSGRIANLAADELSVRRKEITDKVAALGDRQKATTTVAAAAATGAAESPGLAKLRAGVICGDYSTV